MALKEQGRYLEQETIRKPMAGRIESEANASL
jgi:hypothetical protein